MNVLRKVSLVVLVILFLGGENVYAETAQEAKEKAYAAELEYKDCKTFADNDNPEKECEKEKAEASRLKIRELELTGNVAGSKAYEAELAYEDCKTFADNDNPEKECEKEKAEAEKLRTESNEKKSAATAFNAAEEAKKAAELMRQLNKGTDSFGVSYLSVGRESGMTIDLAQNDNNIFYRIIRLLTAVLGTLGVLLLVISGLMMITSHGDENLLTRGKQMFIYTAIGIAVGFLSYAAVQMVISFVYKLA